MRTQGEDDRLHAKERGPGRNQPCLHLDLGLQDCERTHFSVVFVMAALANYHRDIRLFTFKTGPL